MPDLPTIEGHSVHEEVGPSLSKTGQFLISGNKTASAQTKQAHIRIGEHVDKITTPATT